VVTRGERNNNPMNVEREAGTVWDGQAVDQSGDSRFVVFTSPIYGIRAGAKILLNYAGRGLNTVKAIIDTWAPPVENDSGAYVEDVCQRCSIEPYETIDVSAMLPQLVSAIIDHEQGENIYTDQQIQTGVQLARN